MSLVDAKFDADLIYISEVTSRKTKWPGIFGLPCMIYAGDRKFIQVSVCQKLSTQNVV